MPASAEAAAVPPGPWRRSWHLALPLIVSNLSVPLLGMVDSAVVGHLDDPRHLAAVALGATVVTTLYFIFGFLRMGTTALTAQALGAGERQEMGAGLARGLIVAVSLGCILAITAPAVVTLAGWAMAPPTEAASGFASYVAIRLNAAPAALGSLVVVGWFLGLQDARRPLLIMVATNAVNAVLAVLLVTVAGRAADGVALATVIAEWLGLGLGLALAWPRLRRLGGLPPLDTIVDLAKLHRLLAVNRDLFVRSALIEAAFLVMAALGARQGALVLAANALLGHLFTLTAYGLDGLAHATEAMVGRAVGARDAVEYHAAVRVGLINGAVAAALMTLAFWLGGEAIIALLTDQAPVRATAGEFLPYAVLLPILSVAAFVWDGVFFGAARSGELRDAMIIALALFLLALVLTAPLGNHGLWLSFLMFLVVRGGLLWRRHRLRPSFQPLEQPAGMPR